jgi:predicted helicase
MLSSADGAHVFPLNIYGNGLLDDGMAQSNINAALRKSDPDAWFYCVYAVLHSKNYRARYQLELKRDLPRVPISMPNSLFASLEKIGRELVALHLLDFESQKDTSVAVWHQGDSHRQVGVPKFESGAVHLSSTIDSGLFDKVSNDVWEFQIGGYQVCEKWLKDRKGLTLSDEEVAHFQRIVVAISETIRLMNEIDEVIEAHGGWPGAFTLARV